jgi:hypothetical protein
MYISGLGLMLSMLNQAEHHRDGSSSECTHGLMTGTKRNLKEIMAVAMSGSPSQAQGSHFPAVSITKLLHACQFAHLDDQVALGSAWASGTVAPSVVVASCLAPLAGPV